MNGPVAHRRQLRGTGLFDALIALAILSFGLLGLTRFQNRMVAQTTETQSRQVATRFAAEHLSTVLVDVRNAACYTVPQTGSCSNSTAVTRSTSWSNAAIAALPPPAAASAALDTSTNRMTVTISWRTRDNSDRASDDQTRSLTATTDVRP